MKKFAAVSNTEVKNEFLCDTIENATRIAVAVHGFESIAVPSDDYDINIGDHYDEYGFYRLIDGEKVYIEWNKTSDELLEEIRSVADDAYIQAEVNRIMIEEMM